MSKEQHLIIIPGLGDPTKPLEWITRNWHKRYGIIPHIQVFGWQGEKVLFDSRLERLDYFTGELLKKGYTVSLLGISAGSSAVMNVFTKRKHDIHRVVSVCGRLYEGESVRPTLNQAAKHYPIFQQSVLACEKNLRNLSQQDKNKILTIRPLYDEGVPVSTQTIEGATNKQILSVEHMISIYIAITVYAGYTTDFLKSVPSP